MTGYIYQIKNKKTGKSYIGQTKNLNQRTKKHLNRLRLNTHPNPKLQNSWNKYGEEAFSWESWKFEDIDDEKLNQLEIEFIEKYQTLGDGGYNLVEGGGKPPSGRLVKEEDIISFLAILEVYGDGYGKTCEEIFGWAKGTASRAKRRVVFNDIIEKFDQLSQKEVQELGKRRFQELKIAEVAYTRQLKQGGSSKAYSLTKDDFFFAFAAQELGYTYRSVAEDLGISSSTVKDWFSGRSRKKDKEEYKKLQDKTPYLKMAKERLN